MKKSVLVVDDDAMIREMLAAMLRHGGYEPVLADSARRALEICQEEMPSVAFLDIVMPEMDGMELAAAIKADHPDSHLFAISGHSADTFEKDWRDVGFDDFLLKPVLLDTLLAVVANAFAEPEPA